LKKHKDQVKGLEIDVEDRFEQLAKLKELSDHDLVTQDQRYSCATSTVIFENLYLSGMPHPHSITLKRSDCNK